MNLFLIVYVILGSLSGVLLIIGAEKPFGLIWWMGYLLFFFLGIIAVLSVFAKNKSKFK